MRRQTNSADASGVPLLIRGRTAIRLPWRLFRQELNREAVGEMSRDVREVFLEA
jgi:hypothetical protein